MRLSPILYPSLWSPKGLPSPVLTLASVATDLLGSAAVLSLGLEAFFSGARRLGAVLLILGVPAGSLFFGAHYALTGTDAISNQLAVTTTVLFGVPLRVAEACLFTLLGSMLFSGAPPARAPARAGGAPARGGEPQEGLAPLRGEPREERPLGGGGGGLQ